MSLMEAPGPGCHSEPQAKDLSLAGLILLRFFASAQNHILHSVRLTFSLQAIGMTESMEHSRW